jgi:tripartite-type tricarboxylate transporter receptor subunit TctC
VLARPEMRQRLSVLGFESIGTTSAEFAKFIDNEMATYSRIIKDANIKAE